MWLRLHRCFSSNIKRRHHLRSEKAILTVVYLHKLYQVARLLLERGADVAQATQAGETALFSAQHDRSGLRFYVWALRAGCRLVSGRGCTIERLLESHGPRESLELSIVQIGYWKLETRDASQERNANRGTVRWGQALFAACQEGHDNIARLLLECDADATQANFAGMTPYLIASERGHTPVLDLLRELAPTAAREDETSSAPREGDGSETAAELEPNWSRRSLAKRVCSNCGVRAPPSAPKPQKCGGCFGPRYCGPPCQRAHWENGHKAECGASLPAEAPS